MLPGESARASEQNPICAQMLSLLWLAAGKVRDNLVAAEMAIEKLRQQAAKAISASPLWHSNYRGDASPNKLSLSEAPNAFSVGPAADRGVESQASPPLVSKGMCSPDPDGERAGAGKIGRQGAQGEDAKRRIEQGNGSLPEGGGSQSQSPCLSEDPGQHV
jgi:hypothetical protein